MQQPCHKRPLEFAEAIDLRAKMVPNNYINPNFKNYGYNLKMNRNLLV